MKKIFIVGDKFKNFLNNDHTISISEFENMVFRNNLPQENNCYYLGQGASSERVNKIVNETAEHYHSNIKMAFKEIRKSGRPLVHKHNIANSMISVPKKINGSRYQADVFIDDRCSDLEDHITGQHVPGMVIAEACRQMFLAVTEQYYLKSYEKEFYFVIRSNSIEYRRFVFPIDIKIDYEVLKFESKKNGTHCFTVSMNVVQGDAICATVNYEFSTYDSEFIAAKEAAAAAELIQSACSRSLEVVSHETEASL